VIRTFEQARVDELAHYATIPIINALTDEHHPCQALADVMTLEEEFKRLAGLRVAFVGDGNNVCHSLIQAAGHMASPSPSPRRRATSPIRRSWPRRGQLPRNGGGIELVTTRGGRPWRRRVYTDVWASMGQEKEREERARIFAGYCVDGALMALAAPRAVFLHCLPAHRGDEVTDEVMDGPQSRVWDEAENRWYTEQALLYMLITGDERGERLG